jgi:uncharacterized membrane protein
VRLPSIDILRALAIVLMIVVHFVENLSGSYGSDGGPFLGAARYGWLPTGFAAPLFTFLSGVSYRLWLDAQTRRGRDDVTISKATVRRGLLLMLLGFAFNVVVWTPEDVFNWDVLTFIGTAILALDVVRRMPPWPTALTACLVVAVSPALRSLADYPAAWTDGSFDYDFTLHDVALGFLVTGYFPVFPWIAFPIAGFLAAPAILGPAAGGEDRGPLRPLAGGGLLVAASAVAIALRPVLPSTLTSSTAAWTMFPATTAYVLGTLGATVIALTLLHRRLDGGDGRAAVATPWASALSRHALTIYLLHHVVHVWPLWAWGYASTGEMTSLWQVAMPAWIAVVCGLVCVVAMAVVARWMDQTRAPSAESLLRWLSDP